MKSCLLDMAWLTVMSATCTRSSRPGIDRVDDLQAPPLTEELLAVDSRWGRESVFLEVLQPLGSHVPLDSPTPMHIWTALAELSRLFKKERK